MESLLCDTLEALLQGGFFLENLCNGDRMLYAAALAASIVVFLMLLEEEEEQAEAERDIIGPRVKQTRTARRLFDNEGAYQYIRRRDHL
jgi:hypothetical protein